MASALVIPALHAQTPAPSALAIVGARLIDGSGNAPFEGTVVVRGDRIAEVGRSVKPPDGARVIDAQGRTVMPGIVDLTIDLPRGASDDVLARALAAYLYSGVTSVVPANLAAGDVDALRDRVLRLGIKAPRLAVVLAGDRLVRGSAGGGNPLADAQALTDWRQRNATYVPELALAAPADRRAATPLLRELGGGASGTEGDASGAGGGAAGAASAGVSGTAGAGATSATGAPGSTGHATNGAAADPGRWKTLLDQTRGARDAGVRLALGSGAGTGPLPHGWSTLLGARLLVEAGLTPLQAVTAATSGGSWALGLQSDRGFLAVGQRADLIIVQGDPSATIADLERIDRVIVGGDEIDRAALRTLITRPAGAPAAAGPTTAAAGTAGTAGAAGASGAAGATTAGSKAAVSAAMAAVPTTDPKTGRKLTARELRAARRRAAAAAASEAGAEPPSATTAAPAAAAALPGASGTPAASGAGTTGSAATASTAATGTTTAGTAGDPASPGSPAAPGSPSSAPSSTTASTTTVPGGTPAATPATAKPAPAAAAPSNAAAVSTAAAAVVAANPMIDDFEGQQDSSTLGSSWSSAGESNASTTTVVAGRVVRGQRDHALHVTARMGEARDAHARVSVRVAQEGRPLDVSRFHGVRFDARGQGRYRVIFVSRGVSDGRYHESNFSGSPLWTPVSIPFASVGQAGNGQRTAWTGRELVEIVFQMARDPGELGWLELDNIRFY